MHYVKLWNNLIKSSILEQDLHVRWLWIVMLLEADRDGNVYGTPEALARIANLSLTEVNQALGILTGPDSKSTTGDDEGRRVLNPSPNLWFLVNYKKYREIKDIEGERERIKVRVQRHRMLKKIGWTEQLKTQNYRCDCCGDLLEKPFSLYVTQDHDHATGTARGIICQSCNRVVGQIENGGWTTSSKEAVCRSYIERWSDVTQNVTESNPIVEAEVEAEAEAETKKKKERGARAPRTHTPFTAPTVKEVKQLIAEKGYHFDAEAFVAKNDELGWTWMQGRTRVPVKDWRKVAAVWEGTEKRSGRVSGRGHNIPAPPITDSGKAALRAKTQEFHNAGKGDEKA